MIDITFISLTLLLFFIGVYKGFFSLMFNFTSIIVALFSGIKYGKYIGQLLAKYFQADILILKILSFLFIFAVIWSTFKLVEKLAYFFIKKNQIVSISDRIMGGVLGLLSSLILIYMVQSYTDKNEELKRLTEKSIVIQTIKNVEKVFNLKNS